MQKAKEAEHFFFFLRWSLILALRFYFIAGQFGLETGQQ